MINAKKCVLASLLLFGYSGGAFADSKLSGMAQQELNKLGQGEAKQTKAIKGFQISDNKLRTINPNYAETNLTSTYSSMGGWAALSSGATQNVYFSDYTGGAESGQGQPYTNSIYLSGSGRSYSFDERAWMTASFTLDLDIHEQPFIKAVIGSKASDAGSIIDPVVKVNGQEVSGLSIGFNDSNGNLMLGKELFRNGKNSVDFSLRLYGVVVQAITCV